jgi:hypothetical protein
VARRRRRRAQHAATLTLTDALDADAAPARLRRLVRALRLYDAGAIGLAPAGWARLDDGPWQLVDLAGGSPARPGEPMDLHEDQEDELRAFVALAARRMPRGGELAWALRRFDLACEREDAAEALTDLLLALRALLEPEGPESGFLPSRLAALCAPTGMRDALAARAAEALAIEKAVIAGLAPPPRASPCWSTSSPSTCARCWAMRCAATSTAISPPPRTR